MKLRLDYAVNYGKSDCKPPNYLDYADYALRARAHRLLSRAVTLRNVLSRVNNLPVVHVEPVVYKLKRAVFRSLLRSLAVVYRGR